MQAHITEKAGGINQTNRKDIQKLEVTVVNSRHPARDTASVVHIIVCSRSAKSKTVAAAREVLLLV